MQAEWRPVQYFPGYSVSDTGFVLNEETGRLMTRLINQRGVVNVGLTRNRVQYKRAVGRLVADAFLGTRPNETFDCVINLNGDRLNNCIDNLEWRPKWFAARYFNQFIEPRYNDGPVVQDIHTNQIYDSAWDAAIKLGLLFKEVLVAAHTQGLVWPIRHSFRRLNVGADTTSLEYRGI